MPLFLPPIPPPLVIRPFELAVGFALGWMLRGKQDASNQAR